MLQLVKRRETEPLIKRLIIHRAPAHRLFRLGKNGDLHFWKVDKARKKDSRTEAVFLERSRRPGKKGISSWLEETSWD